MPVSNSSGKFEYMDIDFKDIAALNLLGQQGWELVQVIPGGKKSTAILKRAIGAN